MKERAELIEWIRGELVGPSRPLAEPEIIRFTDRDFADPVPLRQGPLAWLPVSDLPPQEVLYYERESPHRKYGAGLLHPHWPESDSETPDAMALRAADTQGNESAPEESEGSDEDKESAGDSTAASGNDDTDDFDVTSPDVRHPSTLGVSFCVLLSQEGRLVVRMPQMRQLGWQPEGSAPFLVNGRYESCKRRWPGKDGRELDAPVWRRLPAVAPDCSVSFTRPELKSGQVIRKDVLVPEGSPVRLRVELFPRRLKDQDAWLVTVVLRNSTTPFDGNENEAVLYQTFFEVAVTGGQLVQYPESRRPFAQRDSDEQSLALLYSDAATWAIGHGCAAGWDAAPGVTPEAVYADVMPAVELPSMTPDIEVDGSPVRLSMREMAALPDDGSGSAWDSLLSLVNGYASWIRQRREEATRLSSHLASVAARHLDACEVCLKRIGAGIALLRKDARVRDAFRLANLAMLLQQIATKELRRRPLGWDASQQRVVSQGDFRSAWTIFDTNSYDSTRVGSWRAFQIAFLLMSLESVGDWESEDREIVDLIWFPTGGGKTEAYLALMAFYMFHERLLMSDRDVLKRDGTNVLMRYTLRMLTTQQFQRAASLICAMEFLRRNSGRCRTKAVPGRSFSLGLWIGGAASPNSIKDARNQLAELRRGHTEGNPLVLTECPWCRAEIGRYEGRRPPGFDQARWNRVATCGISDDPSEGPRLLCPDSRCEFGREQPETWLPVEVIDERIYRYPPSLIIATVDKLAMVAYRPEAGALFGRSPRQQPPAQIAMPPGLIIQDELHLISGPLGSMYSLYEGVFEQLCSFNHAGVKVRPKIIASTATIRGAQEQVKTLYERPQTHFFPSPGLLMGDSFFGRYARNAQGRLQHGRLYLGIHASDYGSVLTTQVRAFSSALFRPWRFAPDRRDPWWTLLAFYNSIRELGGARTLFESDIRSRLKFLFNRENFKPDDRRRLPVIEELTSRLSQADIVKMMDQLATPYSTSSSARVPDACLASNIIEVGVDIDRLSIMGVVGQPKTTSTYIQVTGRVGRRWSERPGLILVIYNPSKSRDRSHFEQFHSYHRRLYERVEPTTATPFAISAIQRGVPGALLVWARQHSRSDVQSYSAYQPLVNDACQILSSRCSGIQIPEDQARSVAALDRVRNLLLWKWQQNPQEWGDQFPPKPSGEYLMLWPGQFATDLQKRRGMVVPTSMRQVDGTAELIITEGYATAADMPPSPSDV